MKRYEVTATICIDAEDEGDLELALARLLDEEGGITLNRPALAVENAPGYRDTERFARVYPGGEDPTDLQARVVDESFAGAYERVMEARQPNEAT